EGRQRVKTVPGGCLIITGTPLHGPEAWEQRLVASKWEAGGIENLKDPTDPNSVPFVSLHQISMWDANIVPHSEIQMEAALMDELEIDARINGNPASLAEMPVFDRVRLKQ